MFPEVFVENIESDKYIVELDKNTYLLVNNLETKSYNRFFGHIVYEDILKYIDIAKPVIKRSFIIVKKYGLDKMSGYLVEYNTIPCLIEIKGYQPYVFISEGDSIEEKDKIGYVVTNKGEVNVIKSPCKGTVVLLINIVWEKPEKYILVVVRKNDTRPITIRKST